MLPVKSRSGRDEESEENKGIRVLRDGRWRGRMESGR